MEYILRRDPARLLNDQLIMKLFQILLTIPRDCTIHFQEKSAPLKELKATR